LSTNKLSWTDPVYFLNKNKRKSKNHERLESAGIKKLSDLIWIIPLRVKKTPSIKSFDHLKEGQLFYGQAKIINIKKSIAFGRRGKGKIQLFNLSVVVKDSLSPSYLTLKWFNSYPNIIKQLDALDSFTFLGEASNFKGTLSITNPKINPIINRENDFIKEYPTINGVAGKYITKFIDSIPAKLWNNNNPDQLQIPYDFPNDLAAFRVIHAIDNFDDNTYKQALNYLIFKEFLYDQLKFRARKKLLKEIKTIPLKINLEVSKKFINSFSYDLTKDQKTTSQEIINDLSSGKIMKRILQGDVGCGKTTVAFIAINACLQNNQQVAYMVPTEALAKQIYNEAITFFKDVELLLGSTHKNEKEIIYQRTATGKINLLIGTHSLFQDSVKFSSLKLAIIDEQHKFGVRQRQRLIEKGKHVHTLLMSATPIPRTLQIARYGDLDISTIKSIPEGRKGTTTRIVNKTNYEKFLSFLKTRISLKEQVYVVVPAIDESILEIENIHNLKDEFSKFFPTFKIDTLHGKLKANEKDTIINKFKDNKTQILISTSVVEVGINIINATVMAIYNPDRFGLSSLHQLRGRVGRGNKPGFCFLVCPANISNESLTRLKILEKTKDGFEIAKADLENRGQGDIFGVDQSGNINTKKIANIFEHRDIFEASTHFFKKLELQTPDLLDKYIQLLSDDKNVTTTI
jgi:ATP-dependent DNA helicase RecG